MTKKQVAEISLLYSISDSRIREIVKMIKKVSKRKFKSDDKNADTKDVINFLVNYARDTNEGVFIGQLYSANF